MDELASHNHTGRYPIILSATPQSIRPSEVVQSSTEGPHIPGKTDKGPQRQWLKEMGKIEDPSCVCDGWTPQNAAHLYLCRGGRGNRRARTRSGVRQWRDLCSEDVHNLYVESAGGQGLAREEGETPGRPGSCSPSP